ncbi:MAG: CaiB/BaiF CoA-transferase family protein, partial [Quisquiliibacterium sp.]
WSQLREINPRLVYCAISGFGTSGPERRTPSFDGKIQAISGLMSITGEPQSGPMRAGFPLGDISTGITAAFAIAGALYQRTRSGKGQFIDVAMLDSMLNFLCYPVSEYLVTGHVQPQAGNLSITRKPSADSFRCKNGHIVLAALTDTQWERLIKTIGCEHLLTDPRFADWPSRIANGQLLHQEIQAALSQADAQVWEARLLAADVPCGRVRDIAEAVTLPQLAHRRSLQQAQTPWGPVGLMGSGFQLEHGNGGIDQPIAQPGEHSREILASIGYDDAAFDALTSAGVTG